jgi:predicted homoserine dehydrogenase-like protein
MRLKKPIAEGQVIHWADVEYDESAYLIRLRREMEAEFSGKKPRAQGAG